MNRPNGAGVVDRADRSGPTCPFPGFRPFEAHETAFFFGRRQPTFDIIDRLRNTSFLAVVGASGSGKSSLVRCGVVPGLHGGLMGAAGSRWRVATSRPRNAPIKQLARALAASALWPEDADTASLIESALRRNSHGLIDVVEQSDLGPADNVLVVIDQFEELFRFADEMPPDARTREDLAFVQLLLEAAATTRRDLEPGTRRRRPGIFVLVTMRSDMLGRCSSYPDLARWVNDGFYLTPLLDREQRREVIEGPVAIAGARIAPRLVNRLLNDAGDDPAMLPPLQHALRRIWMSWVDRTGGFQTPGDGEPEPLDIHDYGDEPPDAGSEADENPLRAHLDAHLEEIYSSLSEGQRKIAERVFRRLTETLPEGQQVRRYATVDELAAVCGLAGDELDDLRSVLDAFRKEGRTFLVPRDGPLQPETLIDISHESLIPSWRRLRHTWMATEGNLARRYRDLSDRATSWMRGEGSRLGLRDLVDKVAWKYRFRSDAERASWAAPYDRRARRQSGYRDAIRFLNRSLGLWAGIVALVAAIGGFLWNRELDARRTAERRLQLQTATALADRDPLLAAGTVADLADDDDVDGLGFALAMKILGSGSLPSGRILDFESVERMAFDSSGDRILVMGRADDRWLAAWHDAISGAPLATVYEGAPLADVWLDADGGVLVGGVPPDASPPGWGFLAIDRGWARASRSPGGSFFAAVYPAGTVAESAAVCIWDLRASAAEHELCARGGARRIDLPTVRRASFPTDDHVVLWGEPDTLGVSRIAVAALTDETHVRVLDFRLGRTDGVLGAAYHADGSLLAAGLSESLRFWDLGVPPDSVPPSCDLATTGRPLALAFGADGVLTSVTSRGQIERRQRVAPDSTGSFCSTLGSAGSVTSGVGELVRARIDEDGWIWGFTREDGGVLGWNPESAPSAGPDFRSRGHPTRVSDALRHERGARGATADESGEVRLWDLRERWSDSVPSTAFANELAFSDDGSRFVAARTDVATDVDQVFAGHDPPSDAPPEPHRVPGSGVLTHLAVDGAGERIAEAEGSTVYLRGFADPPDHEPTGIPHGRAASAIAFSRDGRLLTATADSVHLRSATSGAVEHQWAAEGTVAAADLSPAGTVAVATGGARDGTVRIWTPCDEPESWCDRGRILRRPRAVNAMSFSPGGRSLIVVYQDSTYILRPDVASWAEVDTVAVPTDPLSAARFVTDDVFVTNRTNENTITVWQLAAAREGGRPEPIIRGRIEVFGEGALKMTVAPARATVVAYGPRRETRAWALGWRVMAERIRTFIEPSAAQDEP